MWIAFAEGIDGFLVADHAAHHCDQEIAALCLGMFELGQLIVSLFFGSLAYATGIEDHEIRLVHAALFPPHFVKQCLDALRVGLVHLAANRPDMIFSVWNRCRGHNMRLTLSIKNGCRQNIRIEYRSHLLKRDYTPLLFCCKVGSLAGSLSSQGKM